METENRGGGKREKENKRKRREKARQKEREREKLSTFSFPHFLVTASHNVRMTKYNTSNSSRGYDDSIVTVSQRYRPSEDRSIDICSISPQQGREARSPSSRTYLGKLHHRGVK